METSKIINKLQSIFRTLFDDETIEVSETLDANNIESWDSLNNIMLFVEIEKKFNIKFRSREITRLENVGELIEKIRAKL